MVVAVERLAGYMAQIEAAMEDMQQKKLTVKERHGKGSNNSDGVVVVTEGSTEDCERRDQTATTDEVEQLRCTSVEASVEVPLNGVVEHKDLCPDCYARRVRAVSQKSVDPTDEVITRRLSKDSKAKERALDRVPSVVEFPTYFEHEDTVKRPGDSVFNKLQMFCVDIYWGQPCSVLDHLRPKRPEQTFDL
jgi:hypothetical protein